MVRKQEGLPKLLVLNSRTKSFGNSSIFSFYLLLFAFIQISIFAFWAIDMGLVTLLCLRFRWSWTITLTFTSLRMGDCVPRACIARDSRECCTTHSSVLATMGMLRATFADCPGFMTWTDARLAWQYPSTSLTHGQGPSLAVSQTPALRRWHYLLRFSCYNGTTYHASPDSESGKPHLVAAPWGHVWPCGPSLPRWDDFIGYVCTVPIQPPTQHRQHRWGLGIIAVGCGETNFEWIGLG
jgi:hypothetical protein